MTPTPDEIEQAIRVPEQIAMPAFARKDQQDAERGDWPSPRDSQQPAPPWPGEDDPMLRLLLHRAIASLDAGMDLKPALLQLAVHAWFEGGVENYDRGQRDARRPRSDA
jgi:hypothetical protein